MPPAALCRLWTIGDLEQEIAGVIAEAATLEAARRIESRADPPDGPSLYDVAVRTVYARLDAAQRARDAEREKELFEALKAEQEARDE